MSDSSKMIVRIRIYLEQVSTNVPGFYCKSAIDIILKQKQKIE